MHSVCMDLYKRDSPVNVFMNQIDADLVLSLCRQALPADGPGNESGYSEVRNHLGFFPG